MSYCIEHLNTQSPAILVRLIDPFVPEADLPPMVVILDNILRDVAGDRVHLIVDMGGCTLTLRDAVLSLASLNELIQETGAPNLFHPRVTPLFVESGELVRAVVDSFRRHNQHGPAVRVFATLAEAMAAARGEIPVRKPRAIEGVNMPSAMLRRDIPAPVVHYHLPGSLIFTGNWEQIALDVVTMLAGIDSDEAYLVINAPRLDMTAAEMTALMASTSNPHGGSDISREFHNRPASLTIAGHNLHVVVTGLRHGHYGEEYQRMMKLLSRAMDQIVEAWSIIRAIKNVYGSQLTGLGSVASTEN